MAKEHNKPRLLLLLMAFFRLIMSGKTLSATSKNNKKVRNKSKITLKYKCRKGEAMKKKLKEERNVWISKGHSSGIKSLCLMKWPREMLEKKSYFWYFWNIKTYLHKCSYFQAFIYFIHCQLSCWTCWHRPAVAFFGKVKESWMKCKQ